jgi:hypothetical protein
LSKANGYTDPFYLRFTSEKQNNLILGTSRSAQGLLPSVFQRKLNREFFNFSFTIVDSPYGPVYFNAIKRKINENSKSSIFILGVDPWSISSTTKNPNDYKNFLENEKCLGNMNFFNVNPNFEYILKNLPGNFELMIFEKKGPMYLHKDGWLEVTVPMDSLNLNERIKEKVIDYRDKNSKEFTFSSLRLFYLKKTIKYLSKIGEVYLIRLPIHPEIYKIENNFMPDFNKKMEKITKYSNGYLDLTTRNKEFSYTDGNHLYKRSGSEVSEIISNWIIEKRN